VKTPAITANAQPLPITIHPAPSAARTELIFTQGDSTKATALEIHGNITEYVFGAMITSAAKNH
jgi:hypothetical protein